MNRLEWNMIEEINLLRSNPSSYVQYVREYLNAGYAEASGLHRTDTEQLIKKLQDMPPISRLQTIECVYDAAKKHRESMQNESIPDQGFRAWEWVKKSCPEFQDGNQNIVNGQANVRQAIISLLIDTPAAHQEHREILLNPYWTHVACHYVGTVDGIPHTWVQKFAQKGPPPDINQNQRNTRAPLAPYMSLWEYRMLEEVNLLRNDPPGYVKYVREYEQSRRVEMLELNQATVDELISELYRTPPLSTLQPLECLYNVAKQHGQDAVFQNHLEHTDTHGLWPWHRIEKSCGWTDGRENIVGGADNIRQAIMALLIDEGVSNRGHRRTLLNPKWTHGAFYYVGTVKSTPYNWIQNFVKEGERGFSTLKKYEDKRW
jgi:uncharacterized protein YkwD